MDEKQITSGALYDKHYMQPVRHGDAFVGAVIKPHRTYISNRTRGRMEWMLRGMEHLCGVICEKGLSASHQRKLDHYIQAANSYLGMLTHYDTYAIRRGALSSLSTFWKVCSVIRFQTIKQKSI